MLDRVVLRASGLTKAFKNQQVLEGIDLEVCKGEIVGLVGPSGCGKSTLLRCLNLLEPINAGRIEFSRAFAVVGSSKGPRTVLTRTLPHRILSSAQSTRLQSLLRRRIGLVSQHLDLWEEHDVLGNLCLAPRIVRGWPKNRAEKKARELASQFGVDDKLRSKVWELSGGQRQRVAVARALMMDPKVLFLDEVTSALDPVLTFEMMGIIRRLRSQGLTMLIVTHHLEFALSLCNSIVFMHCGKILYQGPAESFLGENLPDEVKHFFRILQAAR